MNRLFFCSLIVLKIASVLPALAQEGEEEVALKTSLSKVFCEGAVKKASLHFSPGKESGKETKKRRITAQEKCKGNKESLGKNSEQKDCSSVKLSCRRGGIEKTKEDNKGKNSTTCKAKPPFPSSKVEKKVSSPDYVCPECLLEDLEITRTDQLPDRLELCDNDRYVTGYVQGLLDMHYIDCRVRVIVVKGKAYLFSLPEDYCIASDIVCFVRDIPCISCVEGVSCRYEDFVDCQGDILGFQPNVSLESQELTALEKATKNPLPCCRSVRSPILFGKDGIWLPQNTVLFRPLIADPRQVTTSATIRFDDRVIGRKVGAAAFGGDIILLRLFDIGCIRGDLDFGVQCGVFSVFDLEHVDACMVNSDFFVGLMFSYAFDKWSSRFRMWHLSSHLGDEFLLTNPKFPRFNLSDEGVDFFISYNHSHVVRVYGGAGYIVDRDLTFPEKPLYFECGSEIRPFGLRDKENNLYAQPVMGMHFRFWEEQDYTIDQTYVIGMEWSRFRDVGRKIRALFEYHEGFSREGQFVRERSRYYGFRFMYGL